MKKGIQVEKQEQLKKLFIRAQGLMEQINYALFLCGQEELSLERLNLAKQDMEELVGVVEGANKLKEELKKL